MPAPTRPRRVDAGVAAAALALALVATTAGGRPLDVIRDRGVLSLCAHANALPFASRKLDPPGFQIELARALAGELGVGLQIEWVITAFQFRSVDCDIVLDMIAAPEVQGQPRVLLSKPYQRSGVGLALRESTRDVGGFDDLVGRRVAVRVGSLAAMLVGQRGARIVSFGFEDEMVDAVARGEVDVAAVSPASVGYFNITHRDTPLRFVHAYEAEPQLSWNLAVGLRRADAPFRDAVDRAIDRLVADGTVEQIYARYGIEYRRPRDR
jgi:polar amino acid transport system substrate-binding protein